MPLQNLEKAIFGPHWTPVQVCGSPYMTIEHVGGGDHDCRLDGEVIARVVLTGSAACAARVTLFRRGSPKDMQAMALFLSAFGVDANPTYQRGKFSVTAKNLAGHLRDHAPKDNPKTIEFVAGRYV